LQRERFGVHPELPAIARRLAGWPQAQAAIHVVTTATSLDDLPDAPPPT
jgi:hypothetical protein